MVKWSLLAWNAAWTAELPVWAGINNRRSKPKMLLPGTSHPLELFKKLSEHSKLGKLILWQTPLDDLQGETSTNNCPGPQGLGCHPHNG